MSLVVIHNFNSLNAINDSFSCQLRTNNYVISPRSRAGANIVINSVSPVVNTLQMNIFDSAGNFEDLSTFIRFTATPSAVYDIPISPNPSAPSTFSEIQDAIIAALNAQPAFSLFFHYEKNGADKVFLQSKSDSINLFANVLDPFSANVLFANIVSVSSPPIFRNDYKLLVQVTEKQGANYAIIAEQEIIPTYTDIVFFQNFAFAEINIHPHFQNRFNLNRFDFNSASLFGLGDAVMKKVSVTAMEVYEGDLQDGKKFDNLIAFNAGSTHADRLGRNAFANKIASGTFLHNKLNKEVRRHQKHFICFSIPSDTAFKIQIAYLLSTGGGVQTHNSYNVSAKTDFRAFALSANFETLFPASLLGILDDLFWVDVKILDDSDENLFEPIRLNINHNLSDFKQFIFKNYYGVWEGVYADRFSIEDEVYHDQATKPFSMFNDFGDGNTINLNKQLSQNAKASFGYNYFVNNNYLLEFLASDEVYEVVNDEWIPVVFDKNKNEIKNSIENITPFVFEYQYAVEKKVHHA